MTAPIMKPPVGPDLSPPGCTGNSGKGTGTRQKTIWAIFAAFILLLGLIVLVVWALPNIQKSPDSNVASLAPKKGHAPERSLPYLGNPSPESGDLKRSVMEAQEKWFKQKAKAELHKIYEWAGRRYQEALDLSQKGQDLLAKGDLARATTLFNQATDILLGIEKNRGPTLRSAIEEGENALEEGLAEQAMEKFQLALRIDPENQQAKIGLGRSANISTALQMVGQAERQFNDGQVHEAIDTLRKALSLDPRLGQAARLLEKYRLALKKHTFQQAMGRAITAFSEKRFEKSRQALEIAAAVFPHAPEVRQLAEGIREAKKVKRLDLIFSKAGQAEHEGRWEEAVDWYQKALAIDGQNLVALEGMEREERLRAIDHALLKIIKHPERLNQKGPLEDARKTLLVAKGLKHPGATLENKIQGASLIINQYSTPLPVKFVSDGETEVTIYHVGRLGRFKTKMISLLPGRYTISGKRWGYRDVLKQITLTPGSQGVKFFVSCSEKIGAIKP